MQQQNLFRSLALSEQVLTASSFTVGSTTMTQVGVIALSTTGHAPAVAVHVATQQCFLHPQELCTGWSAGEMYLVALLSVSKAVSQL